MAKGKRVKGEPSSASPAKLVAALGVDIDPELLVLSLTHRSFAHEAGGIPTNERLEFLGDSVLGIVVTEELYRRHPERPEGDLAKMRSATVSQKALASVARELDLGSYILLGRGELATGGDDKDSILSDTVEAVLGAIYLCHGLEVAREITHRLVAGLLDAAASLGAGLDWKTSMQEAAALANLPAPVYRAEAVGPDHARVFTSYLSVADVEYGSGTGTSKKMAEQEAAELGYQAFVAAHPRFFPHGVLGATGEGSA